MRVLLKYLGALFQTKIDIEHLHDNQLLTTIDSSSIDTHQNSVINRTSRLFFVLLGITLVGIVFALTIFFIQKMYVLIIHRKENASFVYLFCRHKFQYSKLFKSSQTTDEQLDNAPSTSPLNI